MFSVYPFKFPFHPTVNYSGPVVCRLVSLARPCNCFFLLRHLCLIRRNLVNNYLLMANSINRVRFIRRSFHTNSLTILGPTRFRAIRHTFNFNSRRRILRATIITRNRDPIKNMITRKDQSLRSAQRFHVRHSFHHIVRILNRVTFSPTVKRRPILRTLEHLVTFNLVAVITTLNRSTQVMSTFSPIMTSVIGSRIHLLLGGRATSPHSRLL